MNNLPSSPNNEAIAWFVKDPRYADRQFDGLVQKFSNSIANAPELLQSCTKPSKYGLAGIFFFKKTHF